MTLTEDKIVEMRSILTENMLTLRYLISQYKKGLNKQGEPIQQNTANTMRSVCKRELSTLSLVLELSYPLKEADLSALSIKRLQELMYPRYRDEL